ncbi:YndJ family transporter [Actinoplanes sp. NPDC051633]|uniref:YndJ family transporter n=1 Tax=Actinoplanes sp. NPDC051633 TaxID=3155670 RepID=UPI00341D5467
MVLVDRLTGTGWVALHLVVAVCVLSFGPLGLGVLGRGRPALRLVKWWPVAAVPAVVALLLPRGAIAGLLCVPYLVACLAAPVVLRRGWLAAFAAACLPVAAVGLLAERSGYALLGYPAGVLDLTAAHFHVAGFGALLLISLTVDNRRSPVLAPAGVALVGAGFLAGRTPLGETTGDLIELLGAGLLSAGLWLAVATRSGRAARLLFVLSVVTMGLALLYAAGQVAPVPHLNLTWMVLTHGVLNAAAVLTALVVAWAGREQRWSAHRWSHRIGRGPERFEAASAALLSWEMHRRAGARVEPDTPPASAGLRMASSLGVGRLRVPEPCEVLEVVREPDRTAMHYRALPGHTFEGDERFTVRLADGGVVRLEVAVRSRPALLVARLAGPLVPIAQRLFIARCAAELRRARRPDAAGCASGRSRVGGAHP